MAATEPLIFKHLREEVPNPRQQVFFKCQKKRVLYGGAKMAGKSWAMRRKFVMLAMRFPNLKLLLLRRTLPELRENHIIPLRAELFGYAKYNDDEKAFIFPNGSRIKLGFCDSDSDVLQYQGQEYDVIGFEEAGLFTEYMLTEIALSCRNTRLDFVPMILYTANPGGPGHTYLKRLFVDRDFTDEEEPDDYAFIPATIYDNKIGMERNPQYLRALKSLPEDRRRALLDGDWNTFEGQYFTDFRKEIHVVEPFPIPKDWLRYLTLDYGLDMTSAHWIATDTTGKAYVYREVYKSRLLVSEASQAMREAMRVDEMGRPLKDDEREEELYQQSAPPDLFAKNRQTGKSTIERLDDDGWEFTVSKNSRIQGWYELGEWLKPYEAVNDQTGEPFMTANLQIFSTCRNLIRCLPLLQHAEHDNNDVAENPHEITHAPDDIRYWCSGRPQPTDVPNNKARAVWEVDQYEDYYNASPEDQDKLLKKWGDPF
jgi:phage terminase large subunit